MTYEPSRQDKRPETISDRRMRIAQRRREFNRSGAPDYFSRAYDAINLETAIEWLRESSSQR